MQIANVAFASVHLAVNNTLGLIYGTFDTQEIRSWDTPGTTASKAVTFPELFAAAPSFAVGLTELDIDNGADIRVSASVDSITSTSATLHLDTWEDTRLYSAASVWFSVPTGNPYFQTGLFSTTEVHPDTKPQTNTSRRITFARPYVVPPNVVIWFTMIDMGSTKTWRMKTSATDVTPVGFTLHLDTWADTNPYEAAASWVAYPSDMPGVASGVYSTGDVRRWQDPQLVTNGSLSFPAGVFQRDPTVLLALNHLDIGSAAHLRMSASADAVTSSGMNWHFDSWGDSIIYSAGAAYIAFA